MPFLSYQRVAARMRLDALMSKLMLRVYDGVGVRPAAI
jgi:hypothetical protein